jgi:penicillin amidase
VKAREMPDMEAGMNRFALLHAAIVITACTGGDGSPVADTEADTQSDSTGDPQSGTGSDAGSEGADETSDESGTAVDGEVTITRDAYGVPHVRAATDAAAFYGLGWASAEDRLLQMNASLLTAQGRLAEVFGPMHVERDQRARAYGFWRHALAVEATIDPGTLELLQAYADGVNAWVAEHPGDLNPVFAELGLEPQTWTPACSLAVWYRTADLFSNDPLDKAAAWEAFGELVEEVGLDAAIAATLQDQHGGNPSAGVVQQGDVADDVQQAIDDYAAAMGYGSSMAAPPPWQYTHEAPEFSHAWAVAGDRTSTGAPLLVSDPQVKVLAPNFLYEWSIEGETVHARGASVAGAIGLLIGYTPGVAWGLTAAGLDSRDLFELRMTDETHYTVDGVEHEIEEETETIAVAGGQAREVRYRSSVWGPVITDLLSDDVRGEYALKGTPFSAPDRDPAVALVAMMRARTIDELWAATESWSTPSANLVAAEQGGDVFYTVIGDIPLRSLQSPLGGMIAQDGSSTGFDWLDVIPREVRPWVRNPVQGYVLSGNHRVAGDWYPLPLGVGVGAVGDTIRSRRLKETLATLPAVASPQEIVDTTQWDCVNTAQRDLVALGAHIAAVQPGRLSPDADSLVAELGDWLAGGGSKLTDAPGVSLADRIDLQFRVQQTGPVLDAQFGGGQGGLSHFLDTMMAEIAADPQVVLGDEVVAYVDATLAQAWDAATMHGSIAMGDEAYADTTASPVMSYLVAPDLPQTGIDITYAAPTLQCADGDTIWSQIGETYTQVVDLADVDASGTLLGPGNHEGPEGELWTAQESLWAGGTLKVAPLGAAAIEAIAQDTTTLVYAP